MAEILIVDDAAFMRLNLKRILEDKGHKIIDEAANGIEGYKSYKENKPDLVTMDITMPKMDGIEAVKKIMDFDSYAKVIMCSAMGQQSLVIKAIEAGAKDFIVKPFEKDRIKEAIDNIL